MNNYKPVIGLEIHVELKTKSKMFCQCSADYFEKPPNSNTCPVCLGMPGALPVPNKTAIEWVVRLGLALGCKINTISKFDRKHYSYPDLAKGYQISQYDEPFCINGRLQITNHETNTLKTFRIHRIHLEEDTGKLQHKEGESRIDFNRSGVPLVEIVTEPDFDSSDDVKAFLQELYTIIRYLGISDANMEKGSMRMEPNISVREMNTTSLPPYKVEVKNINSFKFVKQAIDYEVKRHIEILENGEIPAQETRGFDEKKVTTFSQRRKENAADYRFFPDPDIPPIVLTEEEISKIRSLLPKLPSEKIKEFIEIGAKESDAFIITRDKMVVEYYEKVFGKLKTNDSHTNQKIGFVTASMVVNKLINPVFSIDESAQKVIERLKPKETNTELLKVTALKVLSANAKVVEDYKAGKQNAIMFLVGQVMKEMKGQANPQDVKTKLEELLG